MSTLTPSTGLAELAANLRSVPRRLRATMFRSGPPVSDRARSTFIFGNVFLHLHPARVHRWSLRWTTTWGQDRKSVV